MLISKRTTLKPLLESKNGVHLTAYIAHRGEPSELKAQLRSILEEAYEWLSPVMPIDERRRFLEPLDSLLQDDRIISQMKGNVGLFRNENLFRVLNIPIEVESGCHVATSFHVKPLLRWLQVDQEFLFLGVENQTVHLYTGSQNSFKLVDCILIPELTKIKDSEIGEMSFRKALKKKIKDRQAFSWLNELVSEFTRALKPKLFLAGDPVLVQALAQGLRYKNTVRTPVSDLYSPSHAMDLCQSIRRIVRQDSKKSLEKALMEFRFAEEGNRTKKNIFQIARAVVQGRVRKLIVTDELSIFGKIDSKSGGISIHPFDLDHEDDCILDDLAQMVLSQGGEVVVASRDEIPKGRPILAILDHEGEPLVKTEDVQYEVLQERFG